VMIDNTHVVVLRGTGREMIQCPRWRRSRIASGFASWRMSAATLTARRAWRGRYQLSSWLRTVRRLLGPIHGDSGVVCFA